MIVKTGANYQAEGGYIGASREGAKIVTEPGQTIEIVTETGQTIELSIDGKGAPGTYTVNLQNDTNKGLAPTSTRPLGNMDNVLGTATASFVTAGSTTEIHMVAIKGLLHRLNYDGAAARLKCDSEYIDVTNSGTYAALFFKKMPIDGKPVNARIYIED